MLMKLWMLALFCFAFGLCISARETSHEVNGTVIGNQTFTRADGPYLVTSDLIIPQNSSLTLEAGTEFLLVPNVGVRVHGSLLAKGTHW